MSKHSVNGGEGFENPPLPQLSGGNLCPESPPQREGTRRHFSRSGRGAGHRMSDILVIRFRAPFVCPSRLPPLGPQGWKNKFAGFTL